MKELFNGVRSVMPADQTVIVSVAPSAPLAGMKELFKSIDEDKSGTISVGEMRKALSQWGHKISDAEMQQVGQSPFPCLQCKINP